MNVLETGAAPLKETVIKPSKGWRALNVREILAYRELFYFLAWRDIKVRYKQTLIGAAWALIQPLLLMFIFVFVFQQVANVAHGDVPYSVFALTGLVPWTFFNQALNAASDSLVSNTNMVTKVYFPRLILPLASAGSYLVDLFVALGLLFVLMAYYRIVPHIGTLLVPLLAIATYAAALSIGLWFSALNVRYRDVRYVVPFMVQVLLFASPVGYPAAELQGFRHFLLSLNPFTGVAEIFRWAVIGLPPDLGAVAISTVGLVVLLSGGLLYFRRLERSFADVI